MGRVHGDSRCLSAIMRPSSVLLFALAVGAANAGVSDRVGNMIHTNYCAQKTVPRCKEGWWSSYGWTIPVGDTDFGMDVLGVGVPLIPGGAYTWRNNIESLQIAP